VSESLSESAVESATSESLSEYSASLAQLVDAAREAVDALFEDPSTKGALAVGVNQESIDTASSLVDAARDFDTLSYRADDISAMYEDIEDAQELLDGGGI
jgi:hypothetical protein